MINVGLSTTSTYPLSTEDNFAIAKDLGYDGVEILISYPKATRDPAIIRKLSDKYDLPVLSVHAPTLVLTQFTGGRDPLTKLIRSCELAKAVDATAVVAHPPFSVQNSHYVDNFLNIVNNLSTQFNLSVTVENMFPWRVGGKIRNIYNPSWDLIEKGADALTIDFSHAALSGLDGYEMIERNFLKLAHVHLCDGFGIQKIDGKNQILDQHLLPGHGGQRIDESLAFLSRNQWQGSVIAEINTRNAKKAADKEHSLVYTLEYAHEAIKSGVKSALPEKETIDLTSSIR